MSSAPEQTTALDLDVQDASSSDWDALVGEILRSAGDLTPADPDLEITARCTSSSAGCISCGGGGGLICGVCGSCGKC